MSKTFTKSYQKETIIARAGIGTRSIEVPFTPDFIRVKFEGPQLSKREPLGEDQVYWNLVKTAEDTYRLDISWMLYSTRREIHAQLAVLQVNPM